MKAIVMKEDYRKALIKYYGRFPWLMLLASFVGVICYSVIKFYLEKQTLVGSFTTLMLSNAFFYGTVITVGFFYVSRMLTTKSYESAYTREELDQEGYFIPCAMGGWPLLSPLGSLIIQNGSLFFEPDRHLSPDYKFKVTLTDRVDIQLVPVGMRFLAFLLLGESHLVYIRDNITQKEAYLLMPNPKEFIEKIKKRA